MILTSKIIICALLILIITLAAELEISLQTLFARSNITAGQVNINAKNDFTNLAANITTIANELESGLPRPSGEGLAMTSRGIHFR